MNGEAAANPARAATGKSLEYIVNECLQLEEDRRGLYGVTDGKEIDVVERQMKQGERAVLI